MIGSWKRLFLQWVFGLAFLFAGNYLLLGLLDPPFSIARAAFIAVFGSTFTVLPAVLSKLTPVSPRAPGQPGFASTDQRWLCYAALMSALVSAALAAVAPAWEWRVGGISVALVGFLLAYGIWSGRIRVAVRR